MCTYISWGIQQGNYTHTYIQKCIPTLPRARLTEDDSTLSEQVSLCYSCLALVKGSGCPFRMIRPPYNLNYKLVDITDLTCPCAGTVFGILRLSNNSDHDYTVFTAGYSLYRGTHLQNPGVFPVQVQVTIICQFVWLFIKSTFENARGTIIMY